jgi:hypothetical protein
VLCPLAAGADLILWSRLPPGISGTVGAKRLVEPIIRPFHGLEYPAAGREYDGQERIPIGGLSPSALDDRTFRSRLPDVHGTGFFGNGVHEP